MQGVQEEGAGISLRLWQVPVALGVVTAVAPA